MTGIMARLKKGIPIVRWQETLKNPYFRVVIGRFAERC